MSPNPKNDNFFAILPKKIIKNFGQDSAIFWIFSNVQTMKAQLLNFKVSNLKSCMYFAKIWSMKNSNKTDNDHNKSKSKPEVNRMRTECYANLILPFSFTGSNSHFFWISPNQLRKIAATWFESWIVEIIFFFSSIPNFQCSFELKAWSAKIDHLG